MKVATFKMKNAACLQLLLDHTKNPSIDGHLQAKLPEDARQYWGLLAKLRH
jgi:hypothetical protein